jgi:hypothetical protein
MPATGPSQARNPSTTPLTGELHHTQYTQDQINEYRAHRQAEGEKRALALGNQYSSKEEWKQATGQDLMAKHTVEAKSFGDVSESAEAVRAAGAKVTENLSGNAAATAVGLSTQAATGVNVTTAARSGAVIMQAGAELYEQSNNKARQKKYEGMKQVHNQLSNTRKSAVQKLHDLNLQEGESQDQRKALDDETKQQRSKIARDAWKAASTNSVHGLKTAAFAEESGNKSDLTTEMEEHETNGVRLSRLNPGDKVTNADMTKGTWTGAWNRTVTGRGYTKLDPERKAEKAALQSKIDALKQKSKDEIEDGKKVNRGGLLNSSHSQISRSGYNFRSEFRSKDTHEGIVKSLDDKASEQMGRRPGVVSGGKFIGTEAKEHADAKAAIEKLAQPAVDQLTADRESHESAMNAIKKNPGGAWGFTGRSLTAEQQRDFDHHKEMKHQIGQKIKQPTINGLMALVSPQDQAAAMAHHSKMKDLESTRDTGLTVAEHNTRDAAQSGFENLAKPAVDQWKVSHAHHVSQMNEMTASRGKDITGLLAGRKFTADEQKKFDHHKAISERLDKRIKAPTADDLKGFVSTADHAAASAHYSKMKDLESVRDTGLSVAEHKTREASQSELAEIQKRASTGLSRQDRLKLAQHRAERDKVTVDQRQENETIKANIGHTVRADGHIGGTNQPEMQDLSKQQTTKGEYLASGIHGMGTGLMKAAQVVGAGAGDAETALHEGDRVLATLIAGSNLTQQALGASGNAIGLGGVTGGALELSSTGIANAGKLTAAGMTTATAGAHKRAQEKKNAREFLSGERLAKNPILDLGKRGKVKNESGLAEMGRLALKTAGVGLMQNGGSDVAEDKLHQAQNLGNREATDHINAALEKVSPRPTESDKSSHAEENATTETDETAHAEPATSETAAGVHADETAHAEPATSETAAGGHADETAHAEPATSATAATPEHAEDSATAATPEHAEDSATAATPEHEEAAADLEHEDQKSATEETSAKPTDDIPAPEAAAADLEHEEHNNATEETPAEPSHLEKLLGEHRDGVENAVLEHQNEKIDELTDPGEHKLHERPEAAKKEDAKKLDDVAGHAAFTPTPTPKKAPAPAPAPTPTVDPAKDPTPTPPLERTPAYRGPRARRDGWWTRLKRWAGRKATQAGNAIGRAGSRVRGFFGGAR